MTALERATEEEDLKNYHKEIIIRNLCPDFLKLLPKPEYCVNDGEYNQKACTRCWDREV